MRRLDNSQVDLDGARTRLRNAELELEQLRSSFESLLRESEQKDRDLIALSDQCAKFDLVNSQLRAAQDERDYFARQLKDAAAQIEKLVRQLTASDNNRFEEKKKKRKKKKKKKEKRKEGTLYSSKRLMHATSVTGTCWKLSWPKREPPPSSVSPKSRVR